MSKKNTSNKETAETPNVKTAWVRNPAATILNLGRQDDNGPFEGRLVYVKPGETKELFLIPAVEECIENGLLQMASSEDVAKAKALSKAEAAPEAPVKPAARGKKQTAEVDEDEPSEDDTVDEDEE
jgi:hypothetical protein